MKKRRSPCPVSCALEILGDRWTLLVVRDLFFGRTRFKELAASPEKIPTNILSERLARLLRHGVIQQVSLPGGSRRLGYELTEKGRELKPLLEILRSWGLAWEEGTQDRLDSQPRT